MPLRVFLFLLSLGCVFPARAQQPQLPSVELFAGMHRIEAEVASSPESRQIGLMHRSFMAPQRGMLFVFPDVAKHCMWMRNTLLPLSVAFLDEKGAIINIEDMQPRTEDNHCSAKPARFALEMNLGWFRSRGIAAGLAIVGIEKAGPPR
jgi:uncharacterized membrane protein (UPF0127 family)